MEQDSSDAPAVPSYVYTGNPSSTVANSLVGVVEGATQTHQNQEQPVIQAATKLLLSPVRIVSPTSVLTWNYSASGCPFCQNRLPVPQGRGGA